MPPGTGDIQITLAQSAQLSGAIVVTTPHRLAIADTAKGSPSATSHSTLSEIITFCYCRCCHVPDSTSACLRSRRKHVTF